MGNPSPSNPGDATLPPLSALKGKICPRCHQPLSAGARRHDTLPGALARCPVHGLAFVDAQDLASAHGDLLLGTTVAGRFTLLSRLGSGSMGAVYRARQEVVGRDVALKIVRRDRVFDSETKQRFEREARATSALVSPHTVTVFDFGEAEDGSWFLAMEMLVGETLGQRLRRVKHLEIPDAVRFAREALKSLAEAHSKGIVHRDLKPDNLFLMELPTEIGTFSTETCKVLDFGIAKVLRDEEQRIDQLETQAGTVFGTPRYMSPEQAQGNPLDLRSDIYSLGVILYQMIAGRAPFIDDDAVVVMAQHIKEDPPTFAETAPERRVPPAIERVVRRALAKDPAQRPQSADQFIAMLDSALEQSAATASGSHPTSWAGPTSDASFEPELAFGARRSRSKLVLAGLGVVVLALGGFLLVRAVFGGGVAAQPEVGAPAQASPPPVQLQADLPVELASEADAALEDAASEAMPEAAPPKKRQVPRIRAYRQPPAAHKPAAAPAPTPKPSRASERYGRFE